MTSRDMTAAMAAAQYKARKMFGTYPPNSSIEIVIDMGQALRLLIDAETRHVSLIERGLRDTVSRLFIESVQVMMDADIHLPDGTTRRMPDDFEGVCRHLIDDVFVPKNEMYGSSFVHFGAVGVVMRLTDKLNQLQTQYAIRCQSEYPGPLPRALPHIANYATMTLVVLHPELGT